MDKLPFITSAKRIKIYYVVATLIILIFGLRLFYLQIIRHGYYESEALSTQLKQYEIPADRGGIYAYDGNDVVPLVLNETRYRIVADPELVKDTDATANKLAPILNLDINKIKDQLNADSRYEILANKQTKDIKDKIDELKLPGIFTNEKIAQRVYIQGSIAAQILGFVNDEGKGSYGIEQYFDSELSGTPGKIKSLTDRNNVPLLATKDNLLVDPVNGKNIVLTIDVAMQRQLETILKEGLEHAISDSGSVIIMDANSGQVKAMANFPSYDPAKFSEVEDASLFTNPSVSEPLEPGSTMKTLTAAAALDTGSVTQDQTYYDPSSFKVDGYTIKNIEEDGGAGVRSIADILQLSLNTGATWLLMQMGGGELNEQGRQVWYDYMVNHYGFGKITGIEQGYEAEGIIPDPNEGYALNLKFANTAFGQGMTVTPLQLISALTSVVNGGDYYKPTLYSGILDDNNNLQSEVNRPERTNVVKTTTATSLIGYMQNVVQKNLRSAVREGYIVGGKTGTAEIANPDGGYYEDQFNGTYVGFVGGDKPQYTIVVRVNKPKIAGYAGSRAAAPIFSSTVNMLIDNFTVLRKSN
ncbi:penicillin-binding protein 2 [Candidatus Saccharibacteria bacterium]|nr:penicillin-binding protein 2 [Candidatus Saccharibacteria bacterium]